MLYNLDISNIAFLEGEDSQLEAELLHWFFKFCYIHIC